MREKTDLIRQICTFPLSLIATQLMDNVFLFHSALHEIVFQILANIIQKTYLAQYLKGFRGLNLYSRQIQTVFVGSFATLSTNDLVPSPSNLTLDG